jgi:hypothetical protein
VAWLPANGAAYNGPQTRAEKLIQVVVVSLEQVVEVLGGVVGMEVAGSQAGGDVIALDSREVGLSPGAWPAAAFQSAAANLAQSPDVRIVYDTRDGALYGASQSTQRFATAEARDAAKAKYLDGARKRAARLAGK